MEKAPPLPKFNMIKDLEKHRQTVNRQAYQEGVSPPGGMHRFFYPRSIAVVGASHDPQKIGGAVFQNLLNSNFNGIIFPVNPNTPSVHGVLTYPSIVDVPGHIDLAIIVLPAKNVLDAVDQCGKKGVLGMLIMSAGFGETGTEGKERERMLMEKIFAYGMRLIGPNCLGMVNTDADVRLNATFCSLVPPRGNVSMASESGAVGMALLNHASSINLGIAHFVSLGNRIDISSNDLMEFWEDDENTDVILLYLESFGNPRKFCRIARSLSRKKPIIAVKSGKSAVGARAASSHTGALAASDVAVDAIFKRSGVIRVNTIQEMFHSAEILANQPPPKGPNVGILSNSGGPGILAADGCEGLGLSVPDLSPEIQKRLREILVEEAAVANPVDMTASSSPLSYELALSIILEDPNLDSIILIHTPVLATGAEKVAAAIKGVISGYEGDKTILACFMISQKDTVDLCIDSHRYIPSFLFPADAVQALAQAYQYSQYRNMEEGKLPDFPDIDVERARDSFLPEINKSGNGWLLPELAVSLLKEYGIQATETRVACSSEEAVEQARQLGFPVVMKVRSSTIIHKTDVQGVMLSLRTEEDVEKAFCSMTGQLKAAGLENKMQGIVLQRMLRGGQEVIVGMSHVPIFGPLVMVGLGGIQVELLKDVAFSLHPLTDLDPERMLRELKSLPILQGWRGSPPSDIDALKDMLLRFSALIEDFPEIDQMEINPLMVFEKGSGYSAVDARILVR